jgi:hypothetical protein
MVDVWYHSKQAQPQTQAMRFALQEQELQHGQCSETWQVTGFSTSVKLVEQIIRPRHNEQVAGKTIAEPLTCA